MICYILGWIELDKLFYNWVITIDNIFVFVFWIFSLSLVMSLKIVRLITGFECLCQPNFSVSPALKIGLWHNHGIISCPTHMLDSNLE